MSLYSDMYKRPSEKQRQQIFHCSVEPFTQVDGKSIHNYNFCNHHYTLHAPPYSAPDKTMLKAVPNMYKTVNMTYGTGPSQIA